MPNPQYIYKLLPASAAPPASLPSALPVSALDQKSGFIHMSTARQVLKTLLRFFANEDVVYILRIPFAPVEKHIRWESPDGKVCGPRPGEGLFPHIYNGLKLGRDEVDLVARWERGGGWEEGGGAWEAGWRKEVFFGEEEV